eukprot:1411280-Heterocapsa_arctica.AAC.1
MFASASRRCCYSWPLALEMFDTLHRSVNRVWTKGFCSMGQVRPGGAPTYAAALCDAATSRCTVVFGVTLSLDVAKDVPPESTSKAGMGVGDTMIRL